MPRGRGGYKGGGKSIYNYRPRKPAWKRKYGTTWKSATKSQRQARRRDHLAGRGGFFGDLWKGVKTVGKGLWNAAAPALLGTASGMAQNYLHGLAPVGGNPAAYHTKYMNSLPTGRGAYTNGLVSGVAPGSIPKFGKSNHTGGLEFTHSRIIREIRAPTTERECAAFNQTVIDINPGLEDSFPWLSQIAANYENYVMISLIYTYEPTCTSIQSTTGVNGEVLMCPVRADAELFENKQAMWDKIGCAHGPVTQYGYAGVECDPKHRTGNDILRVRYQGLPSGVDKVKYDLGKFIIATSQIPAAQVGAKLGNLYVSYKVRLEQPDRVTANGKAIRQDAFLQKGSTALQCFPATNSTSNTIGIINENSNDFFHHTANTIGVICRGKVPLDVTAVPEQHAQRIAFARPGPETYTTKKSVLELEFPSHVEGDFEIEVNIHGAANQWGSQENASYPQNWFSQFEAYASKGTSAKIINDIFTGAYQGQEASGQISGSSVPAVGASQAFDMTLSVQAQKMMAGVRFHVHVEPSISTAPNKLFLTFQLQQNPANGTAADEHLLQSSIVVREINSLLDGSRADFTSFENQSGSPLQLTNTDVKVQGV